MGNFFNKLNIVDYLDELKTPQVLCLGFFDSLHLGHIQLIKSARLLAHKYAAELSVFTFSNNPFKYYSNKKLVFTFEERCEKLEELFVNNVIKAEFDQNFLNLSPQEFFSSLIKGKDIKAIVVGNDYTFGKKASGNVKLLKEYCNNANIDLYVVDMYEYKKEKLSSTYIRLLIEKGEVRKISHLLDGPYIIEGVVQKGRGVGGKQLGFATANININKDKILLKEGVYYTNVVIDNVTMKAITNVGKKPTFSDDSINIETHVLYYNGDLYNKKIIIEFKDRIRDIKKFETKEELIAQLEKDREFAMKEKYD